MRFYQISLASSLLGASLLLAACGGSDGNAAQPQGVATSDVSIDIDPATGPAAVQAVLDNSLTFPNGVADLGTTSSTSLTLSGTSTAPAFSISADSYTATGVMTYGSCIFKVTTSNYPAGSRLEVGKEIVVKPCKLEVATSGLKTGSSKSFVRGVMGSGAGKSKDVTVSIADNGAVTVNGTPFGKVTLTLVTGATGGNG